MDNEMEKLIILLFAFLIGLAIMYGNTNLPSSGACSDEPRACKDYKAFNNK